MSAAELGCGPVTLTLSVVRGCTMPEGFRSRGPGFVPVRLVCDVMVRVTLGQCVLVGLHTFSPVS